jgi:hypothetical protein
MAYTIIRPGGLKSEAATGNGVLTADASVCGSITREDVANVVIKALLSKKTDNTVRLWLDWLAAASTSVLCAVTLLAGFIAVELLGSVSGCGSVSSLAAQEDC